MEFVIPICQPWGGFQEATVIIREGGVLAVGKTAEGYDERSIAVEEVVDLVAPYMELYDWLGFEAGRILGLGYSRTAGDLFDWLSSHVAFIDEASAKWGRVVDGVGPFSVRRLLRRVYMPYSGHALTLTYVAYPFPDAVVAAENRGKTMAIGSVVVEWGGMKVASAGIRTLAGAFLLAQAAPELTPELKELRKTLEEFVARFLSISACR